MSYNIYNAERISLSRLIISILLYLLSLMISCMEEVKQDQIDSPETGKTGLILTERTALRIDPFIYSSRIDQLNKGDIVDIIGRSKQKSWIGQSNAYWYKIKLTKGILGWSYGKNIKIFSGTRDDIVNNVISDFWDEESKKLKKELSGKWWSIDKNGIFTDHCLQIYRVGKYRSLNKAGETIEGEYYFNFRNKEIVFLNGTSFGHNLNYVRRGNTFFIRKKLDYGELKFTKISIKN
ncbi:MAG: SH3 domain-containing protein [Spirochaetota bacterium]|nr:SH3 domain-containing protein [Spirochaetota bacterium]